MGRGDKKRKVNNGRLLLTVYIERQRRRKRSRERDRQIDRGREGERARDGEGEILEQKYAQSQGPNLLAQALETPTSCDFALQPCLHALQRAKSSRTRIREFG